jgi:hypothetical protein
MDPASQGLALVKQTRTAAADEARGCLAVQTLDHPYFCTYPQASSDLRGPSPAYADTSQQ